MKNKRLIILVFLAPWIISFLVFSVYPLAFSLFLSFTRYNPLRAAAPTFIGIQNYLRTFADPAFWRALWNTTFFALGTIPITTTIAVILAVFLNEKLKLRTFFRASYFAPVVTSIIVIATIFVYIFLPFGPLNSLLRLIGIEGRNWLMDPRFALPAIMVMSIWASFGYYTILMLAGLQNIPDELYEVADIDGAPAIIKFFKITLPLLRPMLIFSLVINTIRSFQIFAEIFVMTQGGPIGTTTTIVFYLYRMGFMRFRMGRASAVAYILFAVILIFSFAQMKLLRYGERLYD